MKTPDLHLTLELRINQYCVKENSFVKSSKQTTLKHRSQITELSKRNHDVLLIRHIAKVIDVINQIFNKRGKLF